MRAPVYRNIETPNTILGLSFPFELLFVLVVFYATVRLSIGLCLLGTLVTYVAVRVVNYGRAPGFLQHWAAWRLRQLLAGGRLSAAARAACPRFPFARYLFRDRGPGRQPGDNDESGAAGG